MWARCRVNGECTRKPCAGGVGLPHSLFVKPLLAIVLGGTDGVLAGVPHVGLGQSRVLCGSDEVTLIMVAYGFAVKNQRFFQVIDGVQVELTRRLGVDGFAIL